MKRDRRPILGGRRTIRTWLPIATLLLSAATACNGVNAQPDDTASASGIASADPASASVTRVETAIVNPSSAAFTLDLPGEVEPHRDAQLAAALGGFVERVSVKSGDVVRKGQVLALIDSASHTARRRMTKVDLDTAKREYDRAKGLGTALPRAQLEAAEARYDGAKAAHQAAGVQASRAVIRAPFSGVVAAVDIEVGEVAAPGAPIIRVVQLQPAKITVSCSDRDVLLVQEGMKASVSTSARAKVFEGEVAHVHPAADTKTRSFIVEIEVPNEDKSLLPGMIASVKISPEATAKQLVIAQDWLVTKPNQLGVFINRGNVAKWSSVEVGPVVSNRVVILKGLAAGDEIVTTGHRELKDGDRLLVARKGVCCKEGRVVFGSQAAAPTTSAKPAASAKP
jgi:membrane fusion protein (multidrug efflux system)